MIDPETTVNSLGYSIFCGELDELPETGKTIINTLNQYSYCLAENDGEFKNALQGSEILLPDGIAIVAAVKILSKKKIRKIAGADLHIYLLNELNKKAGKCFYLGASENTLEKIREKISKDFPAIQVQTFSPPFKQEFSELENRQMIETVNRFRPEVLFIGMTAPKQEKWTFKHKEKLDAQKICSIGAVFDFYAGTIHRPHPFWVKLGLEWFIRLLREPKRMWRRYLYYGPIFIITVLRKKLKQILTGNV